MQFEKKMDGFSERKADECESYSRSNFMMCDSESSSEESDDSLELSESESITDVTPLNSPYCDSPIPQPRNIEQAEERGEMNVLIQAIQRIEVENSMKLKPDSSSHRRKKGSSGRGDPENQRLFKHVVSHQNKSKSHDRLCRKSTVINRYRHLEAAGTENAAGAGTKQLRANKDAAQKQVNRQQKCLSHPSCSSLSFPDPEYKGSLAQSNSSSKNLDQKVPKPMSAPQNGATATGQDSGIGEDGVINV